MSDKDAARAFHARRVAEFRANGGKLNPPLDTVPLLVLTTVGAQSGLAHSTPMSYSSDGATIIVVAANGGAPTNPQWYRNLVTNPEVAVELGGEMFRASASVVAEPEQARLFAQHVALRPNFAEFQRLTTRPLPVIALTRLA